jgi:copper transport protein
VVVAMAVAFAAAVAMTHAVSAHALLQSSSPASGSTVDTPPPVVLMTFGEAPDVGLSSATIVDTDGTSWAAAKVEPVAGNAAQLALPLKKLNRGVYTVSWRTVSSVDGHLAAGSFSFGVQVSAASVTAAAPAEVTPSPTPGWPTILGRVLLYVGLIGMLGAAIVALWVAGPVRGVLGLLTGAWVVSAVGMLLAVGGELHDAGIGVGDALSSSLGTAIVERAIDAAVGGIAVGLVWVRRFGGLRAWALGGSALAAVGGMLADVLASHAAASGAVPFEVTLQLVHIAAAGVWIGGLVALLVALRSLASAERGPAAKRFSLLATAGIGLVAVTGTVRALASLSAWSQLWDTGYGRLVLAKIGLILTLAALGAVNHFRNVPGMPGRLAALRRVGGGELIVAITAISVAGALVNLAPPSGAAASSPAPAAQPPVVATGSDFAQTVRLRLEVAPGTPGFDRFTLAATDYNSGAPVDAATATLHFSLPGGGIADSTLALSRVSAGTYSATGGNLAVAGTWRVEAIVQQATTSVDVVLQVPTRAAPEHISISRAPGQPTIYTVDVGQGRSMQLYLDSEKPGISHFHATAFDAGGNELAVPQVTITASFGGATAQQLAVQRFDAGHVSGQLTLELGSYRFQVTAQTASGDTLSVHLDLSITAEGASPAPTGP